MRSDLTLEAIMGEGSPLASTLERYEARHGQLEMAHAVLDALRADRHLLVEAGTGTGKTLAYLVPAVLSGRRVVVSTATHALQEQVFTKDIPLTRRVLEPLGVTFEARLMKGLSNYLCKRRLGERLESGEPLGPELVQLRTWAAETETGDRGEARGVPEGSLAWADVRSGADTRIGAECEHFDACFVTRMRREAERADVLVVNHHLFFADLALRTARPDGFGGALPPYDAVVFDEAHQIEAVATEFFGVRVTTARVDALVRDARRALTGASLLDDLAQRALAVVEGAAHDLFSGIGRRAGGGPEGAVRRVLSKADVGERGLSAHGALDDGLAALEAHAAANDRDHALALLARRAGELRRDLAVVLSGAGARAHFELDDPREAFADGVVWVEARERSVAIGASPADVGPLLRERLFDRVPAVVCASATLTTPDGTGNPGFHFARARLGAPQETAELALPSPFDFAARAALYVADDLPDPSAPAFGARAAERVAELVSVTRGGAFVLCTSTRSMRDLAERLRARVPGPLLVQGAAPKATLLEAFRAAGNAVLVATMSFWEGVDVPGFALRQVIIDKIPFAVPTDPVVLARSARIEAAGGNPFMQYSVPSAAITLKQGFGRLIRTSTDAGILALLDGRALRKAYGKAIVGALPPARRVASVEEAREFWAGVCAGEQMWYAHGPEPADVARQRSLEDWS